jgi:NAD(P)H-nitrite reductase large subunit
MNFSQALIVAYQAASPRMPGVLLPDFLKAMEGAKVTPVHVDGKCMGAIIARGNEIHASVLPEAKGRWMTKQALRVLLDVIKEHGMATTYATTDEGVRFVKRLGFIPVADKWVIYGN